MEKLPNGDDLSSIEAAIRNELKNQSEAWQPGCLGPEQLLEVVEAGEKPYKALRPLLAHLATCSYCMREFQDTQKTWQATQHMRQRRGPFSLTEWFTQYKSRVSIRSQLFGVATLALASACLLLLGIMQNSFKKHSTVAANQISFLKNQIADTKQQQDKETKVYADRLLLAQQQRDAAIRASNERERQIADLRKLKLSTPRINSGSIALVVDSYQLHIPSDLDKYQSKHDRLRGAADETFALLYPVSTTVPTRQPEFHWERVPGATLYEFQCRSLKARQELPAQVFKTNRGKLNAALQPGQIYEWQLFAVLPGTDGGPERRLAGLPNPAKFKVLDTQAISAISKNVPVRLALVTSLINNGLLDEADHELQFLSQLPSLTADQKRKVEQLSHLLQSKRR